MKSCKQIGVQDISDIEVSRLGGLPDYLFGIEQILQEDSGDIDNMPVLVPTERIVPHAANEFVLETNNEALTVPQGQVVPCYLQNTGATVRVLPADANHPALFIVTEVKGGLARCQASGVAFIPEGHEYDVIAAQYYLTDGEISTHPSNQSLFVPVDRYQLLINL